MWQAVFNEDSIFSIRKKGKKHSNSIIHAFTVQTKLEVLFLHNLDKTDKTSKYVFDLHQLAGWFHPALTGISSINTSIIHQ